VWQGRVVSGQRWFAFLRAINTGNRRLTNAQLLEPFNELGFTDVAAFQAAGNVTFRSDAAVDERLIEATLARSYGFETPTFVRSKVELAAVVAADPFPPDVVAATAGKVQVAFLRAAPSDEQRDAVADLVPDEDQVRVIGREWYWLPVEGISASKLPVGQIERVLGEMTMRTLGTVQRISAKFAA
jgi:uncharacterized protein (DUF1697 family)